MSEGACLVCRDTREIVRLVDGRQVPDACPRCTRQAEFEWQTWRLGLPAMHHLDDERKAA